MTNQGLNQIFTRGLALLNRNRGALGALVVRGSGVAAGFALTLMIARSFGPEANGIYALVTQSAIFLSIIAVGGLDLSVIREFSKAVALNRPIARTAIAGVLTQASLLALAVGAAVLIFEPYLVPKLVGAKSIAHVGLILGLMILVRGLMRVLAAILRSQSRFSESQAIELCLLPMLTIALILAWGPSQQQIGTILMASALAGALVVAVGLVLVLKRSSNGSDAIKVSQSTLFVGAIPMWGMAFSQNIADWFSLFSVNNWSGPAETGIFRVGWQVSSILSIMALSLLGTFAAQIAAAVHNGMKEDVARRSRSATILALIIFGPPSLLVFLFAEPLLAIFGPEFVSGAATLRALTVGQFILAAFGIVGQVMIMVGLARLNLAVSATCAAIIIIFAPFAASTAGGFGVAILLGLVNILKIIIFFFAVRRSEGYNPFTGTVYRPKRLDPSA